jgi:hypothetical protein
MTSFYSPERVTNMWDLWLDNINWNRQKMSEITEKCIEQSKKIWEANSRKSELFTEQLTKSQISMQNMSREFLNSTTGYINHQLEKMNNKPVE